MCGKSTQVVASDATHENLLAGNGDIHDVEMTRSNKALEMFISLKRKMRLCIYAGVDLLQCKFRDRRFTCRHLEKKKNSGGFSGLRNRLYVLTHIGEFLQYIT